jgi:hypothetical protein
MALYQFWGWGQFTKSPFSKRSPLIRRLRCQLLLRGVSPSTVGPHEHDEPRHRPDLGQLRQPVLRAQVSILRLLEFTAMYNASIVVR